MVKGSVLCCACGFNIKPGIAGTEAADNNYLLDKPFYIISLISGLLLTALAVFLALSSLISDPLFSIIMFIIALCILIFAALVSFIYVYSSWLLIQNDSSRTTPGKAGGLLFIPVFNLYWVFQAIWGFAIDYNRYLQKFYPDEPKLPEKPFLAFSILVVLIPLFIFIPVISLLLGLICWLFFIYLIILTCNTTGAITGSSRSYTETGTEANPIKSNKNRAVMYLSSLKANKLRLGGTIFVAIVIITFVFTALIPRSNFQVSRFSVPKQIAAGDQLLITAHTENRGKTAGVYNLTLLIDDNKVNSKKVNLDAQSSKKVVFDLTGQYKPGDYLVNIGMGAFEIVQDNHLQSLKILKPAEFHINNLQLTPDQIDHKEEVRVTVEVFNTGEIEDSMTLNLMINDRVEITRDINLKGETSIIKEFTLQIDEPGLYTISANGTSDILEVLKIERPSNGTMLVRDSGGGKGILRISNHQTADMVVILVDPDEPEKGLMAAYVHAENSYTMRGIRDGNYLIYYSSGENWDAHSKRFTYNTSYRRFEDIIDFETSYVNEGYYYGTWEIKLGSAEDKGVPKVTVNYDQFPSLTP